MSAPGPLEMTPYSVGVRLSAAFTTILAEAQERYFLDHDLYRNDPAYRDLKDAMSRLRGLRYSDDDYDDIVAIEARAFRLLATLRRLNDELLAEDCRQTPRCP